MKYSTIQTKSLDTDLNSNIPLIAIAIQFSIPNVYVIDVNNLWEQLLLNICT